MMQSPARMQLVRNGGVVSLSTALTTALSLETFLNSTCFNNDIDANSKRQRCPQPTPRVGNKPHCGYSPSIAAPDTATSDRFPTRLCETTVNGGLVTSGK